MTSGIQMSKMEITESHARELARQAERKAELRKILELELAGVDQILFEAGCGHGHWLTSYAGAHQRTHCVGIDLVSWRIRKCLQKRDKSGLANLYFYKAELGEFLEVLPQPIRLERTVLLFPDPWPKARHHRRRMVQEAFLDQVAERTARGGQFCFRSDHRPYFDWTVEHLEEHTAWQIDLEARWPHEKETYFQDLMEQFHSVIAVRV
ncbi:MAG: tRNA (guanosine(46)-N7)-methyltransferase TrmB [Opitutales bacterium]